MTFYSDYGFSKGRVLFDLMSLNVAIWLYFGSVVNKLYCSIDKLHTQSFACLRYRHIEHFLEVVIGFKTPVATSEQSSVNKQRQQIYLSQYHNWILTSVEHKLHRLQRTTLYLCLLILAPENLHNR